MSLEEAMNEAARRLLLTSTRGSGKTSMEAEEIMRRVYEAQEYMEAYRRLKQTAAECGETIRDAVEALAEALHDAAEALAEALRETMSTVSSMEIMAKLAEEDMAEPDGREWQRDREREAIPREQARAAARYKAHRRMMAEHKARQHLCRRKYRSGANAGWY